MVFAGGIPRQALHPVTIGGLTCPFRIGIADFAERSRDHCTTRGLIVVDYETAAGGMEYAAFLANIWGIEVLSNDYLSSQRAELHLKTSIPNFCCDPDY